LKLERNEDQQLLHASVQTWLVKEYTDEVWREIAISQQGASVFWRDFADMGWLAAPLPQEHGGLGGGVADACVLADGFGAALVLEPYLSTVVLGAGLIQAASSAAQQAELLPRIAQGELRLALAQAETDSGFALHDVQTRAEQREGGWMLTGEKIAVWDAPSANFLIVVARTRGTRLDTGGIGLFLVRQDAPGVALRNYPMLDRRPGAHVRLQGVRAEYALGDPENGLPALTLVVHQTLAVLAAEACGAMESAINRTVEYLRQRKQFGLPLAQQQVLRHRVVDMHVQLTCSRALALHAALSTQADAAQCAAASTSAKVQCGRAGRWVGHQAIQLHGGMGMTDELQIGHYFKRLVMLDTQFGHADYHQQRAMMQHQQVAAAL